MKGQNGGLLLRRTFFQQNFKILQAESLISGFFAVMINGIDEKFSSFSSESQYIIHSCQIMQVECGKTAEAWLHFTADVAHLV